jgi:hypothetical protein
VGGSDKIKEVVTTGSKGQLRIKLKFKIMARLTPEPILGENWYGSRGLHLICASIHVKIALVALGQQ